MSPRWLSVARAAWIILAIVAVALIILSLPAYVARFNGELSHTPSDANPTGARFFATAGAAASLFTALISWGLSFLLFRSRFGEPIVILLSLFLLAYSVIMAGPLEAINAYYLPSPGFPETVQAFVLFTPMIALLALFPNGRFVPRWSRWLVLLTIPWNLSFFPITPFTAESLSRRPLLSNLFVASTVAFYFAGVYAQIYRYRRVATEGERRQTRWAVFGFALWLAYMLLSSGPYIYLSSLPPDAPAPWWADVSQLGWWLSLSILPLSLTIAITRHQLWDIDLVINRTLVYGALTASVVLLYILIVGGMGLLFRTGDSLFVPLLATGIAAVLFHPLRERLQRGINRLMYGERDDPFAVLAQLGERLETALTPQMVFPTIVETVAQVLKLPYVALATPRGGQWQTVESYGKPVDATVAYPLTYQGETVGQLQVAQRSPGEPFSPNDERILRNVARQAGPAVHAVQLMADLQRSRQQLVAAREEERRRLRRDLHDGLGASLAALNLEAGVLRRSIRSDPEKAEALAGALREDIRATIADIRRLVYELRPPTLDQLGLVAAVRSFTTQSTPPSLQVTLDAPEELPPLPAAVEVAAYRIVQEAVTNVVRHAQARHCRVRLRLDDRLLVEVSDDGVGLALESRQNGGVGLLSMRERAAELGGTCLIEAAPDGGTRVRARLPLLEA